MIATPVERVLIGRVAPGSKVRCGKRSPVTCMVTRHGVTVFYEAFKYASDGRWHFNKIGAVA